ncbi:MAG: leucine-rich repeat domain-containing protein, partial [Candidatus Thorarchaeota archaeon]
PYSMRRPDGYCLNELSMACTLRKEILPIMVKHCIPPLSIHRIQWLDFRKWPYSEENYRKKFREIQFILEGKLLNFDGDHAFLLSRLKPLDFGPLIDRHVRNFHGRKWLFKEIKDWLYNETESPVFFLIGKPGVGKTTISAKICTEFPEVNAFHFVEHSDNRKTDALECVLSLAYQLSAQIVEYTNELLRVNLIDIRKKNAYTLFNEFIIEPLHKIKKPSKPVLIVIDALNEAKTDKGNELVSFLVNNIDSLPSWLKLFITSLPEQYILNSFSFLKPRFLDTKDNRNLTDIENYVKLRLIELFPRKDIDEALKVIIERSEGIFLYAQEVLNDLKMGRLKLDLPESFPHGLKHRYQVYFERHFPFIEEYDEHQRKLLEVITSSKEPLELKLIRNIFGWNDYIEKYSLDPLQPFLEIVDGRIKLFHRSIIEWLTDKQTDIKYFISPLKGHEILSLCGWKLYNSDFDNLHSYFIDYLPIHLQVLKESDNKLLKLFADDKLKKLFSNEEYKRKIRISILNNFSELLLELYYNVTPGEIKFLLDLKNTMGISLLRVDKIEYNTIGVKIEGNNIIELGLYNCGLNLLPESIGNLKFLQTLHLGSNNLEIIPESIGNLSSLKELYLYKNRLSNLPKSFVKIRSLEILDLSYNNLTSLPDSIGNLNLLEKFDIIGNPLGYLPDSIKNFRFLDEIILKYTKLDPKQADFLIGLEFITHKSIKIELKDRTKTDWEIKVEGKDVVELKLKAFELASLPNSIDNLKCLRKMNIEYNNLTGLTESIGNLSELQELNLSHNNLSSIPSSIGNVTSLQELDLGSNNLTSLPESIGNLIALEKLWLENNFLETLPESIKNLRSIRILELGNNQFQSLPLSLGNLKSLKYVGLSRNKISTLPNSFKNLNSLEILILAGNYLNVLPESITELKSLTRLGLSSNQLSTLPESIDKLSSLKELYLFNNKIKFLPESIGNLKSLCLLYLNKNNLNDLPESIGNLSSLKELHLYKNQLSNLPTSIIKLKSLQKLILSYNNFTSLPDSIKDLKSLIHLTIDHNHF